MIIAKNFEGVALVLDHKDVNYSIISNSIITSGLTNISGTEASNEPDNFVHLINDFGTGASPNLLPKNSLAWFKLVKWLQKWVKHRVHH